MHVTVLCGWEPGQGSEEGAVAGTAVSRWKKK